ncbi:MAG: transporter substrate-binding domain-containing protein [Clostridiaceae bacterium]
MKKKLITSLALAVMLTSTFLVGCGSTGTKTEENKKYTIATDATYAPFEFEQDGKYIGIDIDILTAIAEEEKFEFELKPMDFKGIIPALTSNQIDGAIAGMSITDERKAKLDFSEGYFDSGVALVVKKDNSSVNSIDDLKGKIFAVKKGTAGSDYAKANADKLGATVREFDDTPSMFQEVINGNADATFEDYPVIAYNLKVNPDGGLKIAGEKLTSVPYGFAVKKGENAELLKKFNDGLKKIKENGKYDEIISKYIKK